jgi:serine/threonine-protein kinase RIM15
VSDTRFRKERRELKYVIVDGESAARYIKSTNGKNANTPIVAVSAYSSTDQNELCNVFAASLSKPLQKADLLSKHGHRCCRAKANSFIVDVLKGLGFKTSTMQGRGHTKLTASRGRS